MVFENILVQDYGVLFQAIMFVLLGILIGILSNFIIRKISQHTIYKWIGKSSHNTHKKVKLWVKTTAIIIQWLIIFLFIFQALSVFDIVVINEVFKFLISISPRIVAALFMLAAGLILASIISRKIENQDFKNSRLLAKATEWILVIATILSALEVLNIRVTPFMILFQASIYAVALTLAIAFGIALGIALKPQITKLVKELSK